MRAARFDVVLRGYDIAQTDALLDRVCAALPGKESRPTWERAPAAGGQLPAVASGQPAWSLPTSWRGYDAAEVDAYLVRCAHSLGDRIDRVPQLAPLLTRPRTGDPLRARDVEVVTFRMRFGKDAGYEVGAVDALLEQVAAALADDRP